MYPIDRIPAELRANPEFQSAMVRIGLWLFGLLYIGLGAMGGFFKVEYVAYFSLFLGFLLLNLGVLLSVLTRETWEARRYLALLLDVLAVTLAIYLVKDASSPFYLVYIVVFISAGTRYGRRHLAFAAGAAVFCYVVLLLALSDWQREPLNAFFHLLVLILLPMYQDSLLRKLHAARIAAEQANRAKGVFLANMTHELRTPLTGVLGMANLLRATELDDDQREYADAIASSANMLHALIGDILDLSKIDAQKLHLEHESFDLRRAIKDACDVLQTHALSKGLEIICDIAPNVPPQVRGDQLRVRQILFNLVGNAVKFTERGEVVIRAAACPAGEALGVPHIRLEIQDSGIGIPRHKLDAIFESFSQADESTTRRYGGTGLGTTIARDLTLLMGGSIDVASEEGVGTRFSVRLPLPDAADALPHGAAAPTDPALEGKRVVVYERNAELRHLIAETCRTQGMVCFAERDFARVSEDLRKAGSAELLIVADSPRRIDIHAVIQGFQRLLDGEVPCLLLIYSQRRTELGELGCRRLNKPFQRGELLAAIRTALAAPAAPPALPGAAPAPAPAPDPRSIAGTRVLVAEDNAIAARVITTMLRRQGAEVRLVGDGNEALAAAAAESFDCAFIDLRMPGLDGLDFTRRLRAQEPKGAHLSIIALTANAAEDAREECLAAGMDAFLTKPVDPAALIEAAQRFGADKVHAPEQPAV